MVEELWVLIKMLFVSKPNNISGRNLEVITMKYFPFKEHRYMCWCGKVITRYEKKDVINRFLTTKFGKISQIHETVMLYKQKVSMVDNWIRYYLSYFWHWLKQNPLIKPAHACYYCNRYECEAYAQEEHPEYWENYNRSNLCDKYSIKGAKKLYKKFGGTSDIWKAYVKSFNK